MKKTNENLKERIATDIFNDSDKEKYVDPDSGQTYMETVNKITIIYADGAYNKFYINNWGDDDERYDIECKIDDAIDNTKPALKEALQDLECKDMEELNEILDEMGLTHAKYKENDELGYVMYVEEISREYGSNNTVSDYYILGFVSIRNGKLNINTEPDVDEEFGEKILFGEI